MATDFLSAPPPSRYLNRAATRRFSRHVDTYLRTYISIERPICAVSKRLGEMGDRRLVRKRHQLKSSSTFMQRSRDIIVFSVFFFKFL